MGMMVELSKMRQYPRNSEENRVSNHLYGRDNEMRKEGGIEVLNCCGLIES